MHWYLDVLKQYAVFNGRARRKEFWMFALVNFVISIVLLLVDMATDGFDLLALLYSLAVLLPSLGVSIRRLHDTDRSGWWVLVGFVPILGGIILLVLMAIEGDSGPNSHGPNPKLFAVE